jgi:hypothetical protein
MSVTICPFVTRVLRNEFITVFFLLIRIWHITISFVSRLLARRRQSKRSRFWGVVAVNDKRPGIHRLLLRRVECARDTVG